MRFFDKLSRLEQIAQSKPTKALVDEAMGLIGSSRVLEKEFFNNISGPLWLKLLEDRGVFLKPAKEIKSKEGTRYGNWPAMTYLIRLVKEDSWASKEIARVLKTIPKSTNRAVNDDVVRVVSGLDTKDAMEFVPQIVDWIESNMIGFHGGELVADLAVKFAKVGKKVAAMSLISSLLKLSQDYRLKGKGAGKKNDYFNLEPSMKLDSWEYEQVTKKQLVELADYYPIDVLKLSAEILVDSIVFSSRGKEAPYDYSYIWRKAIESHERNSPNFLKSKLVAVVRDIASKIVEHHPEKLEEVTKILETFEWHVFERISIYLVTKYADPKSKLVEEKALNPDFFDSPNHLHEYYELLKKHFPHLSKTAQREILSWIDKGRSEKYLKQLVAHYTKMNNRAPTREEIERSQNVWRLNRLDPIADYLEGGWKQKYDAWFKAYGKPDHPSFSSYTTTWSGSRSPKTVEELAAMSIDSMINYLKTWKPKDSIDEAKDGLALQLTKLVGSNPEKYSSLATNFASLESVYLNGFVRAFREISVKKELKINWSSVLKLFKKIVANRAKDSNEDKDEELRWAAKSVIDVLQSAMKADAIDPRYSKDILDIIVPLTNDPDPDEREKKRRDTDWYTLAINSNRPEALSACIEYALWQKRIDKKADPFTDISEILEAHLKSDSSKAVRSVYGYWIPWLQLLDKKWFKENLPQILPADNKDMFMSAWNTYISFREPYNQVFEDMEEYYLKAVNMLLPNPEKKSWKDDHALERLAQHIMVYYWRGYIKPDNKLFKTFYKKASSELKASALSFVGTALERTEETPSEIKRRIKDLFEIRVQAKDKTELAEFGYWYTSNVLDDDNWALKQMLNVLKVAGNIEPDFKVIEKFQEESSENDLLVAECLYYMVKNQKNLYGFKFRIDELGPIIERFKHNKDKKVLAKTEDLINMLGEKGQLEFRKYL